MDQDSPGENFHRTSHKCEIRLRGLWSTGFDDACALDFPCLIFALAYIDEQFIPGMQIVDALFQLAEKFECMREIEFEGPDDRLREDI